ncbi:tetratricopeptide repeat protein [Glutamicibacter arilaitensis]|uniref:tetratricopeptide repeat protein n=1 Tax=Glutamicibacter arilaitensis TaxID=256701 RepID=UPI003F926059
MNELEAAIARQPHRYGWIQTLAMNMQRMKKYDRALELFAAACEGDPGKMSWRIRWARCARLARNSDLASSILDRLVADFPDDPAASAAITKFLMETGQRWRELDMRLQYEEQHADDANWMFMTAQAASFMSRFELAKEYLNKALSLKDDKSKYWYELGRCLEELGETSDAQSAYSNAVLRSENKTVLEIGVGKIHEMKKTGTEP